MRGAFRDALARILATDSRSIVLLGDIGVHALRDLAKGGAVINFGVREQGMVNVAAGLATQGYYPIVHSIEPFLCERALEQIKLLAYNGLKALFVPCGGSYDYAALGPTHHCPAGPANMLMIPGMNVFVPSAPKSARVHIEEACRMRMLAYVRLTDHEADDGREGNFVRYGGPENVDYPVLITTGTLNRIVPPSLRYAYHYHLTELTTRCYFNMDGAYLGGGKVLLVEEFYSGTMTEFVHKMCPGKPLVIRHLGIPRQFMSDYGTKSEMDQALGFTPENLQLQMELLHNA